MTTFNWPAASWAYTRQSALQVIDNLQRVNESPLSGYTQSLSMPGSRWGWALQFPPQMASERDQLEAFLISLDGRANRVRLWDFKRPRPRGAVVPTGVTLASAAAQFATSLVLQGCRHSRNLLLGGAFEVDSNSDGLGNGWTPELAGTTGAVSYAIVTDSLIGQPTVQQVICANLGTTSGDRVALDQSVPILTPGPYTLRCMASVLGAAACQVRLQVQWYDAGGANVGTDAQVYTISPGAWQYAVTLATTAPSSAVSATVRLISQARSGAAGAVTTQFDAVQFEPGAVATGWPGPATMVRGDWIGLPAQLVRVVEDTTANDAGQMTVQVRHMLRAGAASGSAVTLDRPTALYMRTESGLLMPRQPGQVEPELQCDFVEAFA